MNWTFWFLVALNVVVLLDNLNETGKVQSRRRNALSDFIVTCLSIVTLYFIAVGGFP